MRRIVDDREAIENLLVFSCTHRAAIATRCVDWFGTAGSEADRLSAAVEAFENFICAVEQLQMILHSLNMMTKRTGESFFFLYGTMNIQEGRDTKSGSWKPLSAGLLLQTLHRIGWRGFQQYFGLPNHAELSSRFAQLPNRLRSERQYRAYLCKLRDRIREALRNRRTLRVTRVYNKVKHGSVILRAKGTERVLMVHALRRRSASSCRVVALPYQATLPTIKMFASNTQEASKLALELLTLRFGPFTNP